MEIIRSYPFLFVFMVIAPVIAGLVTAYIGFDNLRVRLKSDRHQAQVESVLTQLSARIEDLGHRVA